MSRWLVFLPALLIIAGDRLTKILIHSHMSAFDVISVIPGWLRIVHTENTGAAFGVLAEGNPVIRSIVLLGVSCLVIVFVAIALGSRSPAYAGILTRLGLSFVLGGAAGNLYDRLVHGSVTDFIEVYHGLWSFPAFNVADSAITMGAAFLILEHLRPKTESDKPLSAGTEVNL